MEWKYCTVGLYSAVLCEVARANLLIIIIQANGACVLCVARLPVSRSAASYLQCIDYTLCDDLGAYWSSTQRAAIIGDVRLLSPHRGCLEQPTEGNAAVLHMHRGCQCFAVAVMSNARHTADADATQLSS